jgi:Lrp/AsnC family transcriptional regulator, leucine-responsive regulatory protein
MLDEIDWSILKSLQENARLPFAEVGRQVGLTAPAVAERVRKLEEAGIISGYHAAISTRLAGLPIVVFIQLGLVQGRSRELAEIIRGLPEVLECHNITGQDCYIIKAAVPSMEALQALIEHLARYGKTTTSVVLSAPVPRRTIDLAAINRHMDELNPHKGD